jgi:hypothetical protein
MGYYLIFVFITGIILIIRAIKYRISRKKTTNIINEQKKSPKEGRIRPSTILLIIIFSCDLLSILPVTYMIFLNIPFVFYSISNIIGIPLILFSSHMAKIIKQRRKSDNNNISLFEDETEGDK